VPPPAPIHPQFDPIGVTRKEAPALPDAGPESVELLDRVKWRKWLKSERSAHLEKLKGDKVQIAPEAIQSARQAIKVLHE